MSASEGIVVPVIKVSDSGPPARPPPPALQLSCSSFLASVRRPLQLRGREEAEAEAAAHHSRLLLTVTGADIFAEGTATDISV